MYFIETNIIIFLVYDIVYDTHVRTPTHIYNSGPYAGLNEGGVVIERLKGVERL